MWKVQQEKDKTDQSSVHSNEDYRFQDLYQENAILKEELADLYSHLMIIDDSNEITENSKISSVGRLIIYDKSKRDTEMLLAKEMHRQQISVLEKEMSFQQSHMKEQSLKMKDMEKRLHELSERCIQLSAETVQAVSLKLKVKELTTQLDEKMKALAVSTEMAQQLINENTSFCKELQNAKNMLIDHELKVASLSTRVVDAEHLKSGTS